MVSYLTAVSSLASLRSIMTRRVAEPRPADDMTGVLRGAGRADHCRRHRGCGNRRVHGSRPLLATPPGVRQASYGLLILAHARLLLHTAAHNHVSGRYREGGATGRRPPK